MFQDDLKELADALGINLPEEKKQEDVYQIPVSGNIISRHHPVSQGGFATPTHSQGHFGLDIENNKGTPVFPIGPGIVSKIYNEGNNPKGGNAIVISHEDGAVVSYYAHLDKINVSIGDTVNNNTEIGTVGISGMIYNGKKRITSPHLHFQVKVNGKDVDPTLVAGKPIGAFANTIDKLLKLAIDFETKSAQ